MTVSELLPCPFCGKPPTIVCPDNSYGSAFVTCGDVNDCPVDLTAWGDLKTGETIEDAKRAWNTRAMKAAEPLPQGDEVADCGKPNCAFCHLGRPHEAD